MRGSKLLLAVICIQLITLTSISGQESYFSINADSLSKEISALNHEIDITVSNVDLQEFLRAVANSSNLNLSVDPLINVIVTNNFHGVKVLDMLIFLERNYPISIEVIGNIVDISQKETVIVAEPEVNGIQFDSVSKIITLDYREVSLSRAAREITKETGNNIILSPKIASLEVNGYVKDMPFSGALEQFAFSNDLNLRVTESGYFILEPKPKEVQVSPVSTRTSRNTQRPSSSQSRNEEYTLEIEKDKSGSISITAIMAPLEEVVQKVSNELKADYYISSALEGEVSIMASNIDYRSFLEDVLKGTKYIFREDNGVFIIGGNENSLLKDCQVFQFQNRTIDNVIEVIPDDLKDGLLITEFPDLNSMLISGDKQRVDRLDHLLIEIDKTVPVILIEVYIVNVSRSYNISTGINAGIGESSVPSQGTLFPAVDVQMGADAINKALQGFDGFGVLNIGNITPNFYLTLKALEEQGILEVSSTPKLSTLNGHEATMKIGETEYYLEETSNYIGSQNPSLSTSKVYKNINAELAINIRPIVSGDDQITLDISVQQSDFTERISNEAPPGSVNRTFESIIRVKNQETIILGGLEEKRNQDSSSGTPLLSRIPILKWLFSSRTKLDQNTKLSIFIKPTIIG